MVLDVAIVAPAEFLTVIINDVLEPRVPVNVGATEVVVLTASTVGTTVSDTTNSLDVPSTKPVSPVTMTS